MYRAWYREEIFEPFGLGQVQFVQVNSTIWVANIIGQHGIRERGIWSYKSDFRPIRYKAIGEGLGIGIGKVNQKALELSATVHMPRIGCGLAGGKWSVVEEIIKRTMTVPVIVYDLPTRRL
jgi:hypothetical protein